MRTLTFLSLSSLLLFGLGFSTLKVTTDQSVGQEFNPGHKSTLISGNDRSKSSYRGSGRRVILASSSLLIPNSPKA